MTSSHVICLSSRALAAPTQEEQTSAMQTEEALSTQFHLLFTLWAPLCPPPPVLWWKCPDFTDTSCRSHSISDFNNAAHGSVSSLTFVSGNLIWQQHDQTGNSGPIWSPVTTFWTRPCAKSDHVTASCPRASGWETKWVGGRGGIWNRLISLNIIIIIISHPPPPITKPTPPPWAMTSAGL